MSALITSVSQALEQLSFNQIMSKLIAQAQQPGSYLTTTAWQQLGVVRTLTTNFAAALANYFEAELFIAQMGYLNDAATLTDSNNNPIPGPISVLGPQIYGVTMGVAAPATGNVPITNAGAPLAVPALGLTLTNHVTGAVYQNLAALTIASGTAAYAFTSQLAGASQSSAAGTVLLIAAASGSTAQLTIGALASPGLVGTDAPTPLQFQQTCQAQLVPVSPKGAKDVWRLLASQAATSVPVTRVQVIFSESSGTIEIYLATASGGVSSGDVAIVAAAYVNVCEAICSDPTVQTAAPLTCTIQGTIYVPIASGATLAQVLAAAEAVTTLADLPIGGLPYAGGGIVPLTLLQTAIQNAAQAAAGQAYASQAYCEISIVGATAGSDGTDLAVPVGSVAVPAYNLAVVLT